MRLVLTGRNLEITPTLRQVVEQRLKKLERLLNDSAVSIQVVLTQEKYRHITEMTLHARGDHMLHGIGDASNWHKSASQAVEKLSHQALKLKDKWKSRKRRATSGKVLPPAPAVAADKSAPAMPRIMRASRYVVKPMSVEDAALKMDEVRETFLVFRNAANEAINILYRRKDGNLGLIEPDV